MKYNVNEEILKQLSTSIYSDPIGQIIKCTNCNNDFEKTFETQHFCNDMCVKQIQQPVYSSVTEHLKMEINENDLISNNYGVQGMVSKRSKNKLAKVNTEQTCPVCKKSYVKQHEGQSLCSDGCKTILKGMK